MPARATNPATAARLAAIGRRVAEARRAGGLSRPALAEQLGISAWHLVAVEQGRRGPGIDLAGRLAEALGVEVETACPCCGRPWSHRG